MDSAGHMMTSHRNITASKCVTPTGTTVLQGWNIAQTPWESQQFLLQFNNGRGECVSTWRTWRSFSTVVL